MKNLYAEIAIFSLLSFALPSIVLAAPALKVCIAPNGIISAKARCSGRETQLSAGAIKALASKLDIAACRVVTASDQASETTYGLVGVTALCQPGEFILNYSFSTSPHSANLINASLLSSDGRVASGVAVTTNADTYSCFAGHEYCNYTLTLTATCCPR